MQVLEDNACISARNMKETCNNEQLGLTQMQAELSQVAIIKAYTCLPAFIFCVALKWRQPTVLCRAVHFEPGQQNEQC